jgi:hypothetical protein
MLFLILIAELIVLYFISRWVTISLFSFFLLIFRARSVAITLLLILEFPGTVIHELSHLFSASIMGVKTGKLTLEPESIQSDHITTGSVAIAETDPFRRFIVGIAPVIGGMIILTTIAYFLQNWARLPAPDGAANGGLGNWIMLGLGYLLFSVSNAMFSSSQDLKGFLPVVILLGIFTGMFYYLGLRIALTGSALDFVTRITTTLVKSLGIVLAVNVVLLIITGLLKTLLVRIFRISVKK